MRRAIVFGERSWSSWVTSQLEAHGFAVSQVESFDVVYSSLEAIPYDLLVYDVSFGVEHLRRIQRLQKRMRIFLVVEDFSVDPNELGVDFLLYKPVDRDVLTQAVQQYEFSRVKG